MTHYQWLINLNKYEPFINESFTMSLTAAASSLSCCTSLASSWFLYSSNFVSMSWII